MKNKSIITEPLNNEINIFLKDLFEEIKITSILKNNIWIAGGFSRLIGICNFNINSKPFKEEITEYLYVKGGDIDLFTDSEYTLHKSMSLINPFEKDSFDDLFSNVFSKTFNFDTKKVNSQGFYNRIKIQFVSKFFYESINDCLNSFDFTNCKFGIELKDNNFYIHYDKEALKYEKEDKLNLEHCNSPLLAKRIMKYIRNKGLELYRSKSNNDILRNYYYKVVTKSWDKVFTENMEISNFNIDALGVNRLEKIINMSQEDLVIFIGQLSIPEYECISQGYGNYMMVGEVDWASKLILEKSNVLSHRNW